jgi:hypothetical protein
MLIYFKYCYNIQTCHKHTNQTKEREQRRTVFWLDQKQKTVKKYLQEEDRKDEQRLASSFET